MTATPERSHLPLIARALALLAAASAFFCAPRTLAQTGARSAPPVAFGDTAASAMRWRLVGPFRGGRVLAVAGIPGDPTTFYFGAVDGGVWRTRNAGLTWEPLFDAQPIASIGAIAIAPSDPTVIYVGTGEADMRSDITFGAGVYKSIDGGARWQHIGLDDTRQIGKVLVNPTNADEVWVAALGHAYGPNEERGVFRSRDGGRSWDKVLYKGPDVGAIDLAFDPADHSTVYAALWQSRRPPWSQYPPDQGPGSGLFKTTDGGATWTQIAGGGFPAGPVGRIGVAVARPRGASAARVYALVGATAGAGLYRSDDGGASWRLVGTDPRLTARSWYFGQVFVDPQDADVVYVPNVALLRSGDGGATWVAIKGAPGGDDYHDLWIDPRDSRRMISGVDQGATLTLDGARTWSSWYNQPTAQFYHVITDNRFPYRIYGAQQDAGTVGTTSRGDDGSITLRDWHPVGAGEAGYIAPDPLDSNLVYGGDTYGAVYRYDRRTGQSQDISPWPISAFGVPMPERKLRFTWTSPIVFDPLDPRTLYVGSHVLLRTRDGGLHWDTLSPDLTGARADSQAAARAAGASGATSGATSGVTVANAMARGWGVIYTIAPSPLRKGLIWIGADDGLVHVTTDGGAHWQNVTPEELSPWSKVTMIEASPLDTGTAYAAVDRHRLDDLRPYIYRTRDYGRHWTRIDQGIAPNAFVNVVRADPARRGLLYAGTELGVYVSLDDGDHWQSLQLNLPVASVRDLAVRDDDLVAGTHGRSFWVLDDLTPLQQMTDDVRRAAAHLFRPERAVRVRRSVNRDTPLPSEIPHGTNPPAGAVIDYWLQAPPAGAVTLEVLDARGGVIRRFSSDDRAAPPARPRQPPQFTSDWLPRFEPPTRNAGLNRFAWDLRYPPPPADAYDYSIAAIAGQGTVAEPQGPLVPPGEYQVRLTVAGRRYTQPLRVEMDPRVRVSDAALGEQLRLALQIWNALAEQYAVAHGAVALRDQLRALAGGARRMAPETKTMVDSLARAAAALADAPTAGDLAALETVIQSADREPTQQARDAFAELRARLDRDRARWEALRTRELAALNARLAREKVPQVRLTAEAPARVELPVR